MTPAATYRSYDRIRQDLAAGTTTVEEITAGYLAAAESRSSLNAFVSVFGHEALEQARSAFERLAAGDVRGKLVLTMA